MGLIEILILAVVQGIAEFLPISSSGHLVVVEALMEKLGRPMPEELLEVNIVLHLGTLLSVLVYYRERILRLLGADRRVIPLLVLGTIPAVLVGLPLKKFCPEALEDPLLSGVMFPITGLMLIWVSRRPPGEVEYPQMSAASALIVGLLQAFAILPGVSRSGSTIVGGLAVGLRRDSAATFAFLLAIPAIGGAGVLEGLDLLQGSQPSTPYSTLAIGMFLSFVVGLAALALLVRIVNHGRLYYFAYWLIPFGIAVTAWQISERFM